ncbi:MAG: hypothetical protein H6528_07035 [Actinobacteria bacterium]|nr:hypothetical protein [Actinomycetota bacterium]MCB8997032.1 hypothetical protein [Actinomycetota bacterium]
MLAAGLALAAEYPQGRGMDLTEMFGLRPFTPREVLAQDITYRQWVRVRAQLVRMRRGVYVTALGDDDRTRQSQRIAAELITRTDHFAMGTSAACLLGLPNPGFTPWDRIDVTIGGKRTRSARGVQRAVHAPIGTDWGPCTDLVDTAVTVAAELPLPQALMVTDAVARRLAGTKDRFVLASEKCRTDVRRRLTHAAGAQALELADPAAESPAESFYRGHMVQAGLPEPRCGVALRGASGKQYFADLLLDGLIIEIDGALKYRTVDDLREEKRREDDLRAMGHPFHRVPVDDLYADPAAEMSRLTRARSRLALPA